MFAKYTKKRARALRTKEKILKYSKAIGIFGCYVSIPFVIACGNSYMTLNRISNVLGTATGTLLGITCVSLIVFGVMRRIKSREDNLDIYGVFEKYLANGKHNPFMAQLENEELKNAKQLHKLQFEENS